MCCREPSPERSASSNQDGVHISFKKEPSEGMPSVWLWYFLPGRSSGVEAKFRMGKGPWKLYEDDNAAEQCGDWWRVPWGMIGHGKMSENGCWVDGEMVYSGVYGPMVNEINPKLPPGQCPPTPSGYEASAGAESKAIAGNSAAGSAGDVSAQIRQIFDEMVEEEGLLSLEVLRMILSYIGMDTRDIEDLYSYIDTNDDGNVDVDEFLSWLLQPGQTEMMRALRDATASSKLGWSVMPLTDSGVLRTCQDLLFVDNPRELGYGRDVRTNSKDYTRLEIAHVWSIIKPDKEDVYQVKKRILRSDMRRIRKCSNLCNVPVATNFDEFFKGKALGLDKTINEKLLLHGTKPSALLSILQNGLDERLSGGLFGKGIYLAEQPEKIDQYCTPDENDPHLNAFLYDKFGMHHPGEVFYCFVVQTGLGVAVHTLDGETNVATGEEVWFNQDKRQLTVVPEIEPPVNFHTLIAEVGGKVKRHREFVVFDSDRTMLKYLIAYRRV